MYKCVPSFLPVLALLTSAAFAGINVTAPGKGTTVQSPVHYAATAGSTSCSKGVASMGIYTSPGVLAYVTNGTSLSTDLTLSPEPTTRLSNSGIIAAGHPRCQSPSRCRAAVAVACT